MILGIGSVLLVLGKSCSVNFLDLLESRNIDALRIVYPACGVRAGNYLSTQLLCFLDSVDSNVARTGNYNSLACDVSAV